MRALLSIGIRMALLQKGEARHSRLRKTDAASCCVSKYPPLFYMGKSQRIIRVLP